MGRQYAKGRNAIAECQRSGQKMRYRDLVEDGHVPGLLVHPDWWEPKHPQEIPVEVDDPVALYRPAPEISIPEGYGNAENLDGGSTPASSFNPATTTTAVAMVTGDKIVVLAEARSYKIGEWAFVELDAGGFHASRITSEADTPSFTIPLTTAITGAAAQGNDVHIGLGEP